MLSDFSQNCTVYEMSKNVVEPEKPETIRRLRVACWINKPTHTNTRAQIYVILIALHCNSRSVNAPQCYVTCTLRLLLRMLRAQYKQGLRFGVTE